MKEVLTIQKIKYERSKIEEGMINQKVFRCFVSQTYKLDVFLKKSFYTLSDVIYGVLNFSSISNGK